MMPRPIPRLATLLAMLLATVAPAAAQPAPPVPSAEIRSGAAGLCGDQPDQVRLHVSVAGVRNGNGMVVVTVYGEKPEEFLAPGRKLARVRTPAKAGITETCMAVPPQSGYAIAVYHDENGDQDFNRTIVGLPAEGYGFSHDVPTTFGLPDYQSVRFTAGAGDQAITVTMHYR